MYVFFFFLISCLDYTMLSTLNSANLEIRFYQMGNGEAVDGLYNAINWEVIDFCELLSNKEIIALI